MLLGRFGGGGASLREIGVSLILPAPSPELRPCRGGGGGGTFLPLVVVVEEGVGGTVRAGGRAGDSRPPVVDGL